MPRAFRAGTPHRDGIDAGLGEPIAIVAMAGRFPGADDVEAFWNNLCEGRDTITRFRADQLDPAINLTDRNDPAYVPARGVIEGVENALNRVRERVMERNRAFRTARSG